MIQKAIENKKIVFYIIFLICMGGLYSYKVLPKQEAPDLNAPVARITAIYPGASQSDMEQFVTSTIEDQLENMQAYDKSFSYNYNSVSTIIVFMKYGVDTDKTWVDLRRSLNDLQELLPDEVQPLQINTDLVDTAGMLIALTGEAYDYDTLSYYGRLITEDLKKTEGVTKFDVLGEVKKEVEIKIHSQKMNQLKVSYGQLIQLLQGQNLEIPSGNIETKGSDIPLRIKGSFESLEDIRNIVLDVSKDNYSVLHLDDIGTVGYVDEDAPQIFKRDGEKAVLLVGYFEDNKNVLVIGDEVRARIERIKKALPEDLSFEEVIFQPEEVNKALQGFIWNLLLGIMLVILVVFIGMGLRNAVVVSLAIPTSILTTLAVMPFVNIKIHTISITAFIVALGMLVDNAIVVSDSIQNKLDMEINRMIACVTGTKEVIGSIFTSTLTTVAAFSPLLLLNSLAGDYVKSLPQVVILTLSASFLFAFLVTPSLAYLFFKRQPHRIKNRKKTLMQSLLTFGLKRKGVAFSLGMVILIALGSTFFLLNIIFFPKADKHIMYMDIKAEKNINIEYTKTVTNQIEALLEQEEGVTHYTTTIGGAFPKYYDTLGVYAQIPETAQIVMDIDLAKTPYKKNTEYANALQEKIDENLLSGKAVVKELEYAEPIKAPISIRIVGKDLDALWEVAKQLKVQLESVYGTKNVRTDYDPYIYEYTINLKDKALNYYGLMKYDVLNEVSIALRGREVGTYRGDGEDLAIRLTSDSVSTKEIMNLMIRSTATGNKQLLKDLGTLELKKSRPSIQNYKGRSSILLMSDITVDVDSGRVEKAFKEKIEKLNIGDIELVYDGESSKIGEHFGNLGITAIFAAVMIFTILFMQFRKIKPTMIILLSLPLSVVGAMFGLFMLNQPISFTGMLGIISLIGIVVNNAIILMEYIQMKRKEGLSVDEAAMEASRVRFRPIILSTVTTVIGLLPLLFSNSDLFKPMATTLVFGLLISTFLTLVFIPLTYSLVYHRDSRPRLDE